MACLRREIVSDRAAIALNCSRARSTYPWSFRRYRAVGVARRAHGGRPLGGDRPRGYAVNLSRRHARRLVEGQGSKLGPARGVAVRQALTLTTAFIAPDGRAREEPRPGYSGASTSSSGFGSLASAAAIAC